MRKKTNTQTALMNEMKRQTYQILQIEWLWTPLAYAQNVRESLETRTHTIFFSHKCN